MPEIIQKTKLFFLIGGLLTVFVWGTSVTGAFDLVEVQDFIWDTCISATCVDQSQIRYYVYNFKNSTSPRLYYGNNTNINVDLSQETKFIIHGWTEDATKPWLLDMARAYYKTDHKYNVILVDWSAFGNFSYFRSVCYVSPVGEAIAYFIINVGFYLNKVHLIAHSLGGQVAGYVGQSIYLAQGEKIRRITGLDAAGPLFCFPKLLNDDRRLSSEDAEFVDAIHTNDGENGCPNNYGTVDFRPNCGSFQNGCNNFTSEGADSSGFCSHHRSYKYYTQSIYSDCFWAVQCSNCSENCEKQYAKAKSTIRMGENTSTKIYGDYFVFTKSQQPYCK